MENMEAWAYEDTYESEQKVIERGLLSRTGGFKGGLLDISILKPTTEVEGTLLIKEIVYGTTKTDKPFTKVIMTSGKSELVGFIWNTDEHIEGNSITFKAKIKEYQGSINSEILEYVTQIIPEDQLPSKVDINKIRLELETYRNIKDNDFRTIVDKLIFEDESAENPFFIAPAATYNHHNYRFGLAEHTLEVVKTAYAMAYTNGLNTDLVVTGALLHDIGKVKVYGMNGMETTYDEYYGMREHLMIGINMVEDVVRQHLPNMDRRKVELLVNIIGSHHGLLEWGAIFEPSHREAYTVHLADMMSSRMNEYNMLSESSEESFVKKKRASSMFKHIVNNKEVERIMIGNKTIESQ